MLRELLPLLFMPIAVTIALMLAGIWLRRRVFMIVATALLWTTATPFISGTLVRTVEGRLERVPAAAAPNADAVVVLSEGRTIAPGRAHISEWTDSDRFFAGVELFLAMKAPLLVFTGAVMPARPEAPTEGDVLARQARALGVPSDRILVTGHVSTTADEAREVTGLLNTRIGATPSILLVTSAFHMARAARAFSRSGLTVRSFPVDFRAGTGEGVELTHFLPSAPALAQTQMALWELYGRAYYFLTGL